MQVQQKLRCNNSLGAKTVQTQEAGFNTDTQAVNEVRETTALHQHETAEPPAEIQKRPWQLDKERRREEKIDRLATDIIAAEAEPLIEEAYKVFLRGTSTKIM